MPEQNKKYRITDAEGAEFYFDSAIQTDKNIEKPDFDKEEKAKKKKRIIIISSVLAAFLIILTTGSFFAYKTVKSFRHMEISIHEISTGFFDYERNMKSGLSVQKNFENSVAQADSLANILDSLILKYPQADTLKRMWAYIKIHKYEKLIHYYLKSNLFENINNINESEYEKIKLYNSDLTHIITILKNIPELYRYKQLYPIPPELAEIVPPHWMVESLKNKIELIDDTLSHNEVIVKEHFPILNAWIDYISNTISPEINEWSYFWFNYKNAVKDEGAIENLKIINDLKQEFPNLELLNPEGSLTLSDNKEFTVGVCKNILLPEGSTIESEWMPILKYLKEKFGYKPKLKIYNHYEEIYYDLRDNKLDFGVLDIQTSVLSYYSKVGIPLASRKWNQKLLVNDYLVSFKKSNNLSGKDMKIGVLNHNKFYIYKYYDEHDINPDTLYNSMFFIYNIDSIDYYFKANKIESVAITEEEYYYLNNYSGLKNQLSVSENFGTSMLSVLWAREGLNAKLAQAIANILIPLPPAEIYDSKNAYKDHPFADWDVYNESMMAEKYSELRAIFIKYNPLLDRINLVHIVNASKISSEELKNALTKYLEQQGLAVILSDEDNFATSVQDNDKIIEFEVNEINKDSLEYDIKIKQKKNNSFTLLYQDKFVQHRIDFPPQFDHKLFDMKSYLDLTGKVVNIEKNTAQILMPVVRSSKDNEISLYQHTLTGMQSNKPYATVKIDSSRDRSIFITLTAQIKKKINIDDYAKVKRN